MHVKCKCISEVFGKKLKIMSTKISFEWILIFSIFLTAITLVVVGARDDLLQKKGGCDPAKNFFARSFFDERCCAGQPFTYSHALNIKKSRQECSIPPTDPQETLSMSNWRYFHCLASRASIAMTNVMEPLTLPNFARVMAANLTAEKQSAILSLLQDGPPAESTSSSNDSVLLIKDFWSKYFAAEYKICEASIPDFIQEQMAMDKKLSKITYAPEQTCTGDPQQMPYPKLPILIVEKLEDCVESFLKRHDFPNISNQEKHTAAGTICLYTDMDLLKEEDLLETDFNFLTIAPKFLTRYLSQSTVDHILNKILTLTVTLNADPKKGDGLTEISQKLQKYYATQLSSAKVSKELYHFYLNSIVLGELIGGIWRAHESLCDGKAHRH